MSFSTNIAFLVGNIGKDPQLKFTQGGTAVCTFSVATSHSYKKDNEWQEATTWHNIVVWGKLGEAIAKLTKGTKVHVEGRIQNRSYEDNNGNKKYVSEIVADKVIGLSGQGQSSAQPQNDEPPADYQTESTEAEDIADDIPF
jgi:single-strand DNA-binding protein